MVRESLASQIALLLIRADPMRIYFPDDQNLDEYSPEAEAIAHDLLGCESEEDCLRLVYRVFCQYFSNAAGHPGDYDNVANQLWMLRQQLDRSD
jgi:hypothetical protein